MHRSLTPNRDENSIAQELSSQMESYSNKDIFSSTDNNTNRHWSVSWSDLMMTMFILFLVLYVYHRANKQFSLGDKSDQLNNNTSSVSADLFSHSDPDRYRLDTLKLEYSSDVSSVDLARDKTVRIILPGDLLFDPGQISVKQKARESLVNIAQIINRTSYMVNVVGHTDNLPVNSGSNTSNWELSTLRACAVARYLIDDLKIDGKRFFVTGHGEYTPVRPNNSKRNRAINRRVEIILTREKPFAPEDVWNEIL